MEALSDAAEEYLERVYWLYEAGIERTQANLARALGVSQPSASEMLRRLLDEGLLSRDERKLIHFTERGHEAAARIVARHRTVEAYLSKVMGIPWDEVHEEAHAMEHSISPRLEAKMLDMVGDVRTCPHGHPIGDYPREPGEPLTAVAAGSEVTVLRLENEDVDILHEFKRRGLEPGHAYRVEWRDGEAATTTLAGPGGELTLSDRLAQTVSVRVDERGDGPVSTLTAGTPAQMQLLGQSDWGM